MCEKKMAIVCFTPTGKLLAERIQKLWRAPVLGAEWQISFVYKPVPFRGWMQAHFQELDALIFIGAMGIVVRDMAPCLKSKLTDPAVVVLDEKGQFVISVLSGHIGGGNALTIELATRIGATPVVTTSSDVNGKIAIDVFAQKNDLFLSSMKQAKLCASEIVSGYPVAFSCEGKVKGRIPQELCAADDTGTTPFHVVVSPYVQQPDDRMLHLIPKAFVIGIGCKKNTPDWQIETRVQEELSALQIHRKSIKALASIDLKQEEEGLLSFAKKWQLPISFYTADQLRALEGEFTPSAFVSAVAGVENVCERAGYSLVRESENVELADCLYLPKSGKDGVTVAIMKIDWSVSFE